MNSAKKYTMELDDLKDVWKRMDRRLEQQHEIQMQQHRETKLERARRSLRPLVWGQRLQILFGIAMIVLGVQAWRNDIDSIALIVAGITLHVYGVATIIAAGMMLGQLRRIDHAAPVLAIQKQLARLRRIYVISGMAVGLTWWLLWIPSAMAFFYWLVGIDIHNHMKPMIYGSLIFGVLGLFATWWFHRWARRPERAAFGKAWDDSLTGASLRKAGAVVDELAQFERE
jgi:sulfite exporter TauE/SafE